jgi:polyhydroxyalkanoate synthesis regulator phasin
MINFEDYIKEKQKIEDKYKQDLIELENKYKIYTSRQISSLEEKVIELKKKK